MSASLGRTVKDPDSTLDYTVDWSAWPFPIASAQWVIAPSGSLTLVAESHTTTLHTIRVTGGTVGRVYTVTSRITDSSGQIDDESFELAIEER